MTAQRNLKITLRYQGTAYHGFQVQQNALTICQVFQDAVQQVLGKRWDVKGCSRTDAGVHANRYCLSMELDHPIPCDKLIIALNRKLPPDVVVMAVQDVALDFHARYHCTGKEYVYRIHNSAVRDPFLYPFAYQYRYPLDESMLHREAQHFVGRHDFRAFCSGGSDQEDTHRTITRFSVTREGEYVLFTVAGDGFLYNMVRIMVGTLVHISMGRISPGSIPDILRSADRSRAGKTMPPWGLHLNQVYYPDQQ